MESDEEDVSVNEVMEWYSDRVAEIWENAENGETSLAASLGMEDQLSSLFQSVLRSVRLKNELNSSSTNHADQSMDSTSPQPSTSTAAAADDYSAAASEPKATVALSSQELWSLLEDDADWLDDPGDSTADQPLSIALTDSNKPMMTDDAAISDEDQGRRDSSHEPSGSHSPKNLEGVSQGINHVNGALADSNPSPSRKSQPGLLHVARYIRSALQDMFIFALTVILICSVIYCLIACHKPTQKWVLRHIQDFIYPFMRQLRLLTLPVLQIYPALSSWHEEACLIKNPFYRSPHLDCWSCTQVHNVGIANCTGSGLANFTDSYYHRGVPFLVKDDLQNEVTFERLHSVFRNNRPALLAGTAEFKSTEKSLPNLQYLLSLGGNLTSMHSELHLMWRINRVSAARVLRSLFRRPDFIPLETEVALQRYLFVDGPRSASYELPLTEFANVWLAQGSGHRFFRLIPTPDCTHACKPVIVVLSSHDILYYNWQFWRPVSLPTPDSQDLSVTYMGSFY